MRIQHIRLYLKSRNRDIKPVRYGGGLSQKVSKAVAISVHFPHDHAYAAEGFTSLLILHNNCWANNEQ
ncbi:hypothetical protein Mapa_005385 [Marchantia paleacea]|nr:hypothetical protein Mapa_005385 [Marchantia paleacea]